MVAVNNAGVDQEHPQASSTEQAQSDTSAAQIAELERKQGQLVIIGGAEDKEGECKILREFLRRSGGMEAHIAVMTVATGLPGEVGAQYIEVFERLGVGRVEVIDTARPEDGSDPRALEILSEVTGVFFTGGNQARITELLKGTEVDKALHKRFAEGVVIAGTSAGAAMMPDVMIVEGEPETNPRVEVARMDEGMGFLPGVVIDQHFAQRGRLGRLISAVVQQPVVLGFGIDENTAIAVNGTEVEVVGEGSVTVLDVSNIEHCNLDELLKDEPLALCGAKLHILPHGYRFDLKKRAVILD
ncbi:cyanophycinase [Thermocoleostomius sinensis]|uniref:Cyanophycinase n=1 Tax=Thermocoleostomius sinensis A174 TaxID=2016057 RepID=A0A9E8ZP89_9CYAN|nr:cyanophycinase [Thermocoleostomius sinensis]WAL62291.1 cyanophycinase [Thermocoleostomius sinensis A174]